MMELTIFDVIGINVGFLIEYIVLPLFLFGIIGQVIDIFWGEEIDRFLDNKIDMFMVKFNEWKVNR